jgi:hypothetical protein
MLRAYRNGGTFQLGETGLRDGSGENNRCDSRPALRSFAKQSPVEHWLISFVLPMVALRFVEACPAVVSIL